MNLSLNWIKSVFQKETFEIVSITQKKYSLIYKLKTNDGMFYVKTNASSFLDEAQLTQYLFKKFPNKIIEILDYNEKTKSFITKDNGITLYQELLNNYNEELIINGIKDYIDIQQNVNLESIINIGIKDLSTVLLFEKLEDKLSFFQKEQQESIMKIKGKIIDDIEESLSLGLKDSVDHGDFHLNNILFNGRENSLVFIDWARTNIANPLFSLFSLFYSLERRLNIKENELTQKMTNIYCDSFKKYWNIEDQEMLKIYEISKRLYPLYFLITRFDLIEFKRTEELNNQLNIQINKLLKNYLEH